MRMRRGYGSGKVKDLLSFKCGIVSVQRENRIKQKKFTDISKHCWSDSLFR